MTDNELSPPRVDPVGIVRYPAEYSATPRAYGPRLKLLASMMLAVFAVVVVVSTGVSLGRYCLTSDGADFSSLTPWMQRIDPPAGHTVDPPVVNDTP